MWCFRFISSTITAMAIVYHAGGLNFNALRAMTGKSLWVWEHVALNI
jgi:hypothetical protein